MIVPGLPNTMTSARNSCSVCGGVLEAHTEAYCGSCSLPFHLNQRSDLPGPDCGRVWINDEYLALEFGCQTCLAPPAPASVLSDILDISEAAVLARMTETELAAAAAAGLVPHRRTSAGIHLFERGDLTRFIERQR